MCFSGLLGSLLLEKPNANETSASHVQTAQAAFTALPNKESGKSPIAAYTGSASLLEIKEDDEKI